MGRATLRRHDPSGGCGHPRALWTGTCPGKGVLPIS
jgi:hypothetical protein